MRRRATVIPLLFALLALSIGAAPVSTAGASPAWLFEGVELGPKKGETETVVGDAVLGSFTIPGLSTVCKKTHYEMTISDSSGKGSATFKALAFTTCTATSPCTVDAIAAEALPWPAKLVVGKGGGNYLVVEGIKISVLYGGAECVLNGTSATIKGSAGGLYDNPTETFAFSPASFAATATKLSTLGGSIDWNATFTTEATGPHEGEALTVG